MIQINMIQTLECLIKP